MMDMKDGRECENGEVNNGNEKYEIKRLKGEMEEKYK